MSIWTRLADLLTAHGARVALAGLEPELLAEVVGKLDIQVELSGGIRDDASLDAGERCYSFEPGDSWGG